MKMHKEDGFAEEISIEEFANDFNGKSKDRSKEIAQKFPWSVKTDEKLAEIEKKLFGTAP